MKLYAHENQSLPAHLKGVAERAARCASFFGATEHGHLAGLLHDLGKAEEEFQKRIRKAAGLEKEDGEKQPHAHHGAALLLQQDHKRGGPVWPVAFAINAHHTGLHDRSNLQKRALFREKALAAEKRLLAADPDWKGTRWPIETFGKNLPEWLDTPALSTAEDRISKLRAVDLYTRFLFSALVDADRLDTEEHAPETKDNFVKRHTWRFGDFGLAANGAPEKLLGLLDAAIEQRKEAARSKGASADVLKVRAQVVEACEMAARKPRGVFTLNVPTGGGKTLASVYFALKHIAAQNRQQADPHRRLRRIIVVIPFLNIIQQTVRELMEVFQHNEDDPVVLEHHSQGSRPGNSLR